MQDGYSPSASPISLPLPPLEAVPLNSATRSGERCKLSQWDAGQNPGRKFTFVHFPFQNAPGLIMLTLFMQYK